MMLKWFCLIVFVLYCRQCNSSFSATLRLCERTTAIRDSKFRIFLRFIQKYNKSYFRSYECARRFLLFKYSMRQAKYWQSHDVGSARYGVTRFSDLAEMEYRLYLGTQFTKRRPPLLSFPYRSIPTVWDWRQHKAVNPVKNQGKCGSCYAFSVVGNLEGIYAVKHKKLLKLSEQQIIDCDVKEFGCNGGFLERASHYVTGHGSMSYSDYPYIGETKTCGYQKRKIIIHPKRYFSLSHDERMIAQYLHTNGPISAAVYGSPLFSYRSGVLNIRDCSKKMDHAVLLVGYGVSSSLLGKKLPYWIVKNSWGTAWGENGYFRIARGKGMCGINLDVSSVTID